MVLVFLHQGGEADHVREHHRSQPSVQGLTHRDGSHSCGEVGFGSARLEVLVGDEGQRIAGADPEEAAGGAARLVSPPA